MPSEILTVDDAIADLKECMKCDWGNRLFPYESIEVCIHAIADLRSRLESAERELSLYRQCAMASTHIAAMQLPENIDMSELLEPGCSDVGSSRAQSNQGKTNG